MKRILLIFNLTLRKKMHCHETLVSSQLINSSVYSLKYASKSVWRMKAAAD